MIELLLAVILGNPGNVAACMALAGFGGSVLFAHVTRKRS